MTDIQTVALLTVTYPQQPANLASQTRPQRRSRGTWLVPFAWAVVAWPGKGLEMEVRQAGRLVPFPV